MVTLYNIVHFKKIVFIIYIIPDLNLLFNLLGIILYSLIMFFFKLFITDNYLILLNKWFILV